MIVYLVSLIEHNDSLLSDLAGMGPETKGLASKH